MTADALLRDCEQYLAAGTGDYETKPIRVDVLVAGLMQVERRNDK